MKCFNRRVFFFIGAPVVVALSCEAAPVWKDIEGCRFFYSLQGTFHNRKGSLDDNLLNAEANMMNAPPNIAIPEPPKLPISEALVKVLNDRNASTLQQVFVSLGMSATEDREDLGRWKKEASPLLDGRGDRYFKIVIQVDGSNDVGGSYGGLDIRVRVESLHRSEDIIYGEAKEAVKIAESESEILKNLNRTYKRALQKALQDLKGRLDGEKRMPRARLHLFLNTKGLNAKQSEYVAQGLFPCLYGLGSSLSHRRHWMSEPHLMHLNVFEIEYRLKKFDPSETEEVYLQKYASQIEFETGAHGKRRCTSWHTPLEGLETVVEPDVQGKRISISWGNSNFKAPFWEKGAP